MRASQGSMVTLLIVVLLCAVSTMAQGRTRPRPAQSVPSNQVPSDGEAQPQKTPRRVRVILKNSDPLAGNFIKADSSTLQIEVAGNVLTIKLDDVQSIQLGDTPTTPAPNTDNASAQEATLSIEAGLVFRSGDTKPVSRAGFYLLDASLVSILRDAGLKPDETYGRSSAGEDRALINTYALSLKYGSLPRNQSFREAAAAAVKPHIISSVTTDFAGRATFSSVKPGTYYLMGYSETPRGYVIWNIPVELKPGSNSVVLDQNNAVTAI